MNTPSPDSTGELDAWQPVAARDMPPKELAGQQRGRAVGAVIIWTTTLIIMMLLLLAQSGIYRSVDGEFNECPSVLLSDGQQGPECADDQIKNLGIALLVAVPGTMVGAAVMARRRFD